MTKLNILVIDDNPNHLAAAQQTLAGHFVTCCSTHEEAVELLSQKYDYGQQKVLKDQYRAQGMDFKEYYRRAQDESRLSYWDVVLTDLLMPAGPMMQGEVGRQYVGQEMAIGWALALEAARCGAKYVAVVSDANHHDHPSSAMLDDIHDHIFTIDGARVLMTNLVPLIGIAGTEGVCPKCNGTGKRRHEKIEFECHECSGTGRAFTRKGKDWENILGKLLSGNTVEED